MIEKNYLILMNEIISKIYNIDDFDEMRISVLNLLKLLIPFSQASFYLASDSHEHLLCKPVGINIASEELQRYIDEFEDIDYTRWIFMSGKCMVYRETDLFSDEKRESEDLYKRMYAPTNIHYSAQMSIAYHDSFLGIISLYRDKSADDFSDEELFILDLLKEHLSNKLHQRVLSKNKMDNLITKKHLDMSEFVAGYHLTVREVEVLGLLLGGFSNEKIGEILCISSNTLKKHSASIYKKLGVKSRLELYNLEM